MFGRTEHAIQTLLALFQCAVILTGVLLTTAFLKLNGYPDPGQYWPPVLLSARDGGLLLLVIPILWAPATVFLERNRNFPKRATLASGILILLGLMFFFAICGIAAFMRPVHVHTTALHANWPAGHTTARNIC